MAPTLLEWMMLSSAWTSSKQGAEDKTLGWTKTHILEMTPLPGEVLRTAQKKYSMLSEIFFQLIWTM